MFLRLLQRYSLKVTFALALLIGLQLPHFLNLYETRLDAHYQESKMQLKQYQTLADLLFEGELHTLLNKHKNSSNTLFKAETIIIEDLVMRNDYLFNQKMSLQGSPFKRYVFLLTQVNQPLFIETQNSYQANIVLNAEAIIIGLIIATLVTLLLESMFFFCSLLVSNTSHKRVTKRIK